MTITPTPLLVFVIYVFLALPVLLFGVAWHRNYRHALRVLPLPTLSAILLFTSAHRGLRVWLLGSDYSHRLYLTIELNMLLAIVAAVYFVVTKRWIAGLAALILAADWFFVGLLNSMV
jgi:hypothetical protein